MFKSKKTLVSIVVAVAMLLTLMPMTAVLAATGTGGAEGSVTVSNYTPVIGVPTIDALTSTGTITLTIPVTDHNTLNDITEIWVVLGWAAGGADPDLSALDTNGEADVDLIGIMKWTATAGDFTLVGPTGTNWSVANKAGASVEPTLTANSGDFVFEFTVSEVARYGTGGVSDGWDVYIMVTDGTGADTDTSLLDKAMAAYASVSAASPVDFGSVVIGASQVALSNPADKYVTTSVVNKGYALQINSENWTGVSSGTLTLDADGSPATDALSLEVDDDGTKVAIQYVTASAVTITGHATDGPSTVEAGDAVDIYLWISMGSSITVPETYGGTITMTVVY